MSAFQELGLSSGMLEAVRDLGWTEPTPIQTKAIPAALQRKDIVGIAQTGTGKTGAFMIPAIERSAAGKGLQILVLCPTRELAQQVAADAKALVHDGSLRVADVVGGVAYGPQNDALKRKFEIVAATPGRLNDHIERGNVDLSNVRVLVLDEADRMLDMGFRPQIEEVLRRTPKDRQTMLFSATMPQGVHALALRITTEPLWVEATPEGTTAEGIEEAVYTVRPDKKPDLLVHLLDDPTWDQVLVFMRTKVGADALQTRLKSAGIATDTLHSDRRMEQRVKALDRFASGKVRVLVATDVAQRGLDVEGISHVVNYDAPVDPEDYVHRIGRTGRAGAKGTAVTFATGADLGYVRSIELRLGRSLPRVSLPEYDYAGGSPGRREKETKGRSRAGRGMGSRSADELSAEELKTLLKRSE
jgi:ATP-dependent RNA helicase RhlE